MPGFRFALRLLAYADAVGAQDELIGDVLEEIARGRSRLWVYQQVIGLYGLAFRARVRRRARLTLQGVLLGLCVVLSAGVWLAPLTSVLEMWLSFYFVTGTLSLFAHMGSRAVGTRATVLPETAEVSSAG